MSSGATTSPYGWDCHLAYHLAPRPALTAGTVTSHVIWRRDQPLRLGLSPRVSSGSVTVPVRLRFDKVVVRLLADLQAALAADVPAGTTVLVSCTAPIRVPGRTAVAIAERARAVLARPPARRARVLSSTIHGNQVGVRVVTHTLPQAPHLLGFVHNPGPRPADLLDAAAEWLTVLGDASARRAQGALDRYLCEQRLPRRRRIDGIGAEGRSPTGKRMK